MSREPATEKSFTYFALLEAFDKEGCPVCRFMAEYSLHYIDTLIYEQVNDVEVRRKLRASRGFCNWHAWQARDITSSALGVAIIAKDLISEEMTRLDDLLRGVVTTGLQHPRPAQDCTEFLTGLRSGVAAQGGVSGLPGDSRA